MVFPVSPGSQHTYRTDSSASSPQGSGINRDSSMRSLAADDDCSGSCSPVFTILTYPFVLIWQVVTWPFVQLYQLLFGGSSCSEDTTSSGARRNNTQNTNTSDRGIIANLDRPVFINTVQAAAQGLQINPARLRDIPTPIDWNRLQSDPAIRRIQLPELIDCFDNVFGLYYALPQHGFSVQQRTAMRDKLDGFVQFILARDTSCRETSATYFDTITCLVKSVIRKLKDPSVPEEKKIRALQDLSAAAEECFPRRFEESLRIYKDLNNQGESLDECFRKWLQECKEDIILESFLVISAREFHVLNHARLVSGDKWGLDRTNTNLADDHFVRTYVQEPDPNHPGRTREIHPERYDQVLTARFIPEAAIYFLYHRQKEDGKSILVTDYLQQLNHEGRLPDDFDYDVMYDRDGITPSYAGIAFLAERLGFFTRGTP